MEDVRILGKFGLERYINGFLGITRCNFHDFIVMHYILMSDKWLHSIKVWPYEPHAEI